MIDQLRHSLLRAVGKDGISADKFFSLWFEGYGSAYYFLFSKNLSVTNIQFAELLSLLQCHTYMTDENNIEKGLQFTSISEFKGIFAGLVDTLSPSALSSEDLAVTLAGRYLHLLERTIVVEPLYGSCAVFIPPHLKIQIERICALSGYVHSCGPLIYLAESQGADVDELVASISEYVGTEFGRTGKEYLFSIYAQEDFAEVDAERAFYLREGLEEVKVFIDKSYVGDTRLIDLPDILRQRCPRGLVPISSQKLADERSRRGQRRADGIESMIWLLGERLPSEKVDQPGGERFYVCYHQILRNANAFHIFDENKPAWWSPTTLPHTLAGAMINVTRPWWPRVARPIDLIEPFAGSGTIGLEALKFNGELRAQCSDIEDISTLLVTDNIHFFGLGYDSLLRISTALGKLSDGQRYLSSTPRSIKLNEYDEAIQLLNRLWRDESPFELSFSKDFVTELGHKTFMQRLWFYLAVRAALRNAAALKQQRKAWSDAYIREVTLLRRQVNDLLDLRKRQEKGGQAWAEFDIFEGKFSKCLTLRLDCIKATEKGMKGQGVGNLDINVGDARLIPEDSADLIITDPPYGFNTDEDSGVLAALYENMLLAMVKALRKDGQLVLCLPDRSYTGRRTPEFARQEFVTASVHAACAQAGREVAYPGYIAPGRKDIFRPPFYWDSRKALRRSILHFRIGGVAAE